MNHISWVLAEGMVVVPDDGTSARNCALLSEKEDFVSMKDYIRKFMLFVQRVADALAGAFAMANVSM